jgi:hypothetical protein
MTKVDLNGLHIKTRFINKGEASSRKNGSKEEKQPEAKPPREKGGSKEEMRPEAKPPREKAARRKKNIKRRSPPIFILIFSFFQKINYPV